jgi:hypothetical protein
MRSSTKSGRTLQAVARTLAFTLLLKATDYKQRAVSMICFTF